MDPRSPTLASGLSRRRLLGAAANGFGLLGLADLLEAEAGTPARSVAHDPDPLAARPPHHAPRAKRAIFLFMNGGPSHVDLFDPKPRLTADHGKPLPFEKPKLARTTTENLMASPFKFSRHGASGIEVSGLLPQIGARIDDLCVIRAMVADNINHPNACLQLYTGEQVFSRPSLGSWVMYGLGSENRDLPGFVAICPGGQDAALWGSSFLPASYQGTRVADLKNPIANLSNPRLSSARQRHQLDLLGRMNERHRIHREEDSRLEARIASFELAFRMQVQAPEAFDISSESEPTRRLYGLDQGHTEPFGKQCLIARRLVERGVRFVQLHGNANWDHHTGIRSELPKCCAGMDRPVAGLLTDLKARGLLDETLVIWGGEFGRSPVAQKGDGRDHHPYGFTMWLAGGGVKGGHVHGATDEFGWYSVDGKVHIHDLHATILHLMGLDHERLTYRYGGRDYRLTDVHGTVVEEVLA
ncbi:MAG TPA: DUF1501 domain-containing protein [Isosphaeraceae bacterium]|nr:DUF1501 domain-containing protein [Isosphaeraceae bacterium]